MPIEHSEKFNKVQITIASFEKKSDPLYSPRICQQLYN